MKPPGWWRPVPGFEGLYEVSAEGQVWSLRSLCLMAPQPARHGYQRVSLYIGAGKRVSRLIHQLVLEAFVGSCPDGMEARHYPCRDKANNDLLNLSWATKSVNHLDQVEHGTHPQASKTCCPRCQGPYRREPDGTRYCPPCHLNSGRAWRRRQRDNHERDALATGLVHLYDIDQRRQR